MNVGTLKTLSYLSSLGLLAGIGYKIYLFLEVEKNVSYINDERTKSVLAVPAQPVKKRVGLNYDTQVKPAITEFDWTGAPPPEKEIVDPGTKEPEAPKVTPVTDLLSVVMVMASETKPESSRCVLRFKDQPKDTRDQFFGVGDALPKPNDNVAVFSIRRNEVVFSFDDEAREKESLEPSTRDQGEDFIVETDEDGVVKPSLRNFSGGSRTAGANQEVRKTTEKVKGAYRIGTDDADVFDRDYQRILSEDVTLETYMKDGKRAGLKVREVKAGSIAARHGVQAEDVVISINGNSVTSEQQAIQYVRQNSDSTSVWNVRILRNGREVEEVYHSPED